MLRYQLDLLSLGPDAPNAIKARSLWLCIAWHSFASPSDKRISGPPLVPGVVCAG